jgi:hypothetical protein
MCSKVEQRGDSLWNTLFRVGCLMIDSPRESPRLIQVVAWGNYMNRISAPPFSRAASQREGDSFWVPMNSAALTLTELLDGGPLWWVSYVNRGWKILGMLRFNPGAIMEIAGIIVLIIAGVAALSTEEFHLQVRRRS